MKYKEKWNWVSIYPKIFHTYGLKEPILKCPYHPKQSTDTMQSLSKYQQNFHTTRRSNTKVCVEPQKLLNRQSDLDKEVS